MKEGGIVRRLFDVSVSILMAAVLLMSQSWAVTAAYADYSVNGSTDSTNLNSEDSNAIDDGSGPEGQESNASPVVNESQDTQQGSSISKKVSLATTSSRCQEALLTSWQLRMFRMTAGSRLPREEILPGPSVSQKLSRLLLSTCRMLPTMAAWNTGRMFPITVGKTM